MKHHRGLLIIGTLILTFLACRVPGLGGGQGEAPNESTISESDFPMTADAYNVLDLGDGSILFYTRMSSEDLMSFYRNKYTASGYIENELLTTVTDGVFNMVFDGDPSGRAVVIQSVDLGDGSRTVTIRLE